MGGEGGEGVEGISKNSLISVMDAKKIRMFNIDAQS